MAQILFGTSHDPREGLQMIKIKKIAPNKIRFSLNFEKSTNLFSRTFCFCFTVYTKRKCSRLKQKMGAKRPLKPSYKYKPRSLNKYNVKPQILNYVSRCKTCVNPEENLVILAKYMIYQAFRAFRAIFYFNCEHFF